MEWASKKWLLLKIKLKWGEVCERACGRFAPKPGGDDCEWVTDYCEITTHKSLIFVQFFVQESLNL